MLFLTRGPEGKQASYGVNKTNWKYILIVLILAVIVGGGILGYLRYFEREIVSFTKFPEIKKSEKPKIEEETANWKTYRNEKYEFEVKYPEDWTLDEWIHPITGEFIISFHPPEAEEPEIFTISVIKQTSEELEEWIEGNIRIGFCRNRRDITIGVENYKGVEVQFRDRATFFRQVYINRNSLTYRFIIEEESPTMPIFNQMLSTFTLY
jgi:hypothetical protein